MLLGLNTKLSVLFEQREILDKQIAGIRSEIDKLSPPPPAPSRPIEEVRTVAHMRRRQPKALIEAASEPRPRRKRKYNTTAEGRAAISEARKRYWAELSPRAKAALIRRQIAGKSK